MKFDIKTKSVYIAFALSLTTSFIIIALSNNKIKLLESETNNLKANVSALESSNAKMDTTISALEINKQELENKLLKGAFKSKVHYNYNNVSEPSGATIEQLKYALADTKLAKYVNTFLEVEKEYNVNALFMIGIVANESAWLKSNRALSQNNVTGYAVYSDSSKGKTFSSIEESILITAKLLSSEYLDPNGKHHNGTSVKDVNTKYSADEDWHSIVNSVAVKFKSSINNFTDYLYPNT